MANRINRTGILQAQSYVISAGITLVFVLKTNYVEPMLPLKNHIKNIAGKTILMLPGLLVILLIIFSFSQVHYNWQWYRIPPFLTGAFLKGLGLTMKISSVSMILAIIIGTLTAVLRGSASLTAGILSRFYLETIRNTPLLIQLFFFYFVIAPLFSWSPFFTAVLALALFEGAYMSEIIRGGINALGAGQWEAAASLGLSGIQTYRKIILPQALKIILPPLGSQLISLVKDSALVSTIALYDLTMAGQDVVSRTFLTFEVWFTIALVYLLLTTGLSILLHVFNSYMFGRTEEL